MPKNLSVEQKANRLEICQDLQERLKIVPNFLDNVITGDESWVFDYDPETKRQISEWHTKSSPRPKKAHMSRYKVKTKIIVFFRQPWHCAQGICTSRTDSKSRLLQGRLRKGVQRVRTDIADDWVLHHDNAPAHTALSVREFLAKKTFPYFHTLPTAQI